MRKWKSFYESQLLHRKLLPNEYLFPTISPNGQPHPEKPLDHNMVQKNINEFASAAGIKKHYSTHSFRRGGAQYRFMFAPLGERWSLSTIRWWVGWAKGEHVSTVNYNSLVLGLQLT